MSLEEIPNDKNDAGPLPEMETYEDALALSQKENDHFFVVAFRLKSWLTDLLIEGFTRLAPDKQQPFGSPQTGQSWRGFMDIFGHVSDGEFPGVMEIMHRFIKHTDPLPQLLLRAQTALVIEHRLTGNYEGIRKLPGAATQSSPTVLDLRRVAERWCEWLDATIHLETHGHCQLSRSRSPIELKSEIVAFGQPLCWLPKPEPPNPLHPQSECWPCREVETLLIALQPLARSNRWTCGDLLVVVRTLGSQALAYPCWSEADLISYRHRALALPPLPPGPAPENADSFPAGLDVAISLCPPLSGNFLGHPLWS